MGVPGSDLAYDNCRVCGPNTDPEDDCTVPWLLGHVAALERGAEIGTVPIEGCEDEDRKVYDYTCLSDPAEQTTWFSCSRNPQSTDCAHPGVAMEWDEPVDPQAACEAHFGTLAEPGSAAAAYPEAVGRVGAVPMLRDASPAAVAWDEDCEVVYACETSYCREEDGQEPPPQCGTAPSALLRTADGVDWTVPEWADVPNNSGFFGSERTPGSGIEWAAASVGWRQLHPEQDTFVRTGSDEISYDLINPVSTEVLDEVSRGDVPYWLRVYTAAQGWAPGWLSEVCTDPSALPFTYTFKRGGEETPVQFLPIWDECIWREMLNMYKVVLSDARCAEGDVDPQLPTCPIGKDGPIRGVEGWDLKSDEKLRMVYIPGAFRYAEYGLGPVDEVARSGQYGPDLEEDYTAWFTDRMVADLVALMGDDAHKLVFTGEDMPYSIPNGWDTDRLNHLPQEAVAAGLSIRNGITENHSNHHYHMPAYGTFIDWSGHVIADEDWVAYDGQRMLATEQECFNLLGPGEACGSRYFDLDEPDDEEAFAYEVTRANLVSLQARMNHMYVKPSVLAADVAGLPAHWAWVRANLSQRPEEATEAWVTLGLYRDKFFERDADDHDWLGRPWVQNTEKHIAQRDVCGGGRSRAGSWCIAGDDWECDPVRMTNIEGRQTNREENQDFLYFDVHERFSDGPADYELAVTYVNAGGARWHVEYGKDGCLGTTEAVQNDPGEADPDGEPICDAEGGGDPAELRTAWFSLEQAVFDGALPGATDLRIYNGGEADLEVRMVRLVRRSALGCGDGIRTADEACDDGNTDTGDGCAPTCQVEPGWACDGAEPDACACAEGFTGEACDEVVCDPGCVNGTCVLIESGPRDASTPGPDSGRSSDSGDSGSSHGGDSRDRGCACPAGFVGQQCQETGYRTSCKNLRDQGESLGSGMYTLQPEGAAEPIEVYCDMDTAGGGWTVVWASTEGCSPGRPWDEFATPDDVATCGPVGTDPRLGRARVSWEALQAMEQSEHILLRPGHPDSWLQTPWLRVNHGFFPGSGWNNEAAADVTVFSASQPDDGRAAALGLSTDEEAVQKGGWYGLAVVQDEDIFTGLDGSSSTRIWTNDGCRGHLVGIYRDAHMFTTDLTHTDDDGVEHAADWDFLGWPATSTGCRSAAESTAGTWIGVR